MPQCRLHHPRRAGKHSRFDEEIDGSGCDGARAPAVKRHCGTEAEHGISKHATAGANMETCVDAASGLGSGTARFLTWRAFGRGGAGPADAATAEQITDIGADTAGTGADDSVFGLQVSEDGPVEGPARRTRSTTEVQRRIEERVMRESLITYRRERCQALKALNSDKFMYSDDDEGAPAPPAAKVHDDLENR